MIFVDSNAFIALVIKKDKFHVKAIRWWAENKNIYLITSNFIFIETLGWIRYKNGKTAAVEAGKNFFGGDIVIEKVTAVDEILAWELFQKTEGRGISMIDCTTAVLMKRLKIKDIFTFDEDFASLGFNTVPS